MSIITETLKSWSDICEINIDEVQFEKFEIYAKLLIEWNEKINLTAITEPKEIAIKHFIDSLTVMKVYYIKKDAKIIDVGTGAGFPSIPLKIIRDDIKLTLLDSLNKRLVFLKELCSELGLETDMIHARAEEAGRLKDYREKYDIAVSRAVANLPSLCEYCMPFVKVGGVFISMKGKDGLTELKSAEKSIQILGGRCEDKRENIILPNGEIRKIFVIEKIKATDQKYPRRGVKISKQPLK